MLIGPVIPPPSANWSCHSSPNELIGPFVPPHVLIGPYIPTHDLIGPIIPPKQLIGPIFPPDELIGPIIFQMLSFNKIEARPIRMEKRNVNSRFWDELMRLGWRNNRTIQHMGEE